MSCLRPRDHQVHSCLPSPSLLPLWTVPRGYWWGWSSCKEREKGGIRSSCRVPRPEKDAVVVKKNSESLVDARTCIGGGFRLQPSVPWAIPKASSVETLVPTLVRADPGGLGQDPLPSEEETSRRQGWGGGDWLLFRGSWRWGRRGQGGPSNTEGVQRRDYY